MLSSQSEPCVRGFGYLHKFCDPPTQFESLQELERRHLDVRRSFGDCALVGASGSLVNSSLGGRIDSFTSVIRVNRAPTKKWERDVGRRTSVRVMSADELAMMRVYRSHNSKVTLEEAARRRPSEMVVVGCHGPFRGRCDTKRLLRNIHPLLNTYLLSPLIAQRAANRSRVRQRSPPAGMMALEFALASCTNVTVFGFATPACASRVPCYHYYSRSCRFKETGMRFRSFSGGFHDFNAQEATLSDLDRRSIINRVSACQINATPSSDATRHNERLDHFESRAVDGGAEGHRG